MLYPSKYWSLLVDCNIALLSSVPFAIQYAHQIKVFVSISLFESCISLKTFVE